MIKNALSKGLRKLVGFLDRHGPAVQSGCAVVGVCIAALMIWSLKTSMKQLELSIEPRLEVSGESPAIDLGSVVKVSTNYALGVPITNVITPSNLTTAQSERVNQAFSNLRRITFKNAGAVGISDVEVAMRLEVDLDSDGTVTNAVYEHTGQIIARRLRPSELVVHDFAGEPVLTRLLTMPRDRARSHVVCYVIRYRRTIDMKPKIRLLCFEAFRLSYDSDVAFAVPTGISSISYYPDGVSLPRVVKAGIWHFLEQLDIVSPLDD